MIHVFCFKRYWSHCYETLLSLIRSCFEIQVINVEVCSRKSTNTSLRCFTNLYHLLENSKQCRDWSKGGDDLFSFERTDAGSWFIAGCGRSPAESQRSSWGEQTLRSFRNISPMSAHCWRWIKRTIGCSKRGSCEIFLGTVMFIVPSLVSRRPHADAWQHKLPGPLWWDLAFRLGTNSSWCSWKLNETETISPWNSSECLDSGAPCQTDLSRASGNWRTAERTPCSQEGWEHQRQSRSKAYYKDLTDIPQKWPPKIAGAYASVPWWFLVVNMEVS